MLDPHQFYCWVLCNGMKMRFRMVMIAHPGPGIGFHKRFMWRIIIPPTTDGDGQEPAATNMRPIFNSEHLAEDPVLAHTGTVEEPTAAAGITMKSEAIEGDIAVIGEGDDFEGKIRGQIKAANPPEGWTEQEGHLLFHDRLYVPDEGTLCMQIIRNHHDH